MWEPPFAPSHGKSQSPENSLDNYFPHGKFSTRKIEQPTRKYKIGTSKYRSDVLRGKIKMSVCFPITNTFCKQWRILFYKGRWEGVVLSSPEVYLLDFSIMMSKIPVFHSDVFGEKRDRGRRLGALDSVLSLNFFLFERALSQSSSTLGLIRSSLGRNNKHTYVIFKYRRRAVARLTGLPMTFIVFRTFVTQRH